MSFGMFRLRELGDVNMFTQQKFKLTRIYPTKQEFFNTLYFSWDFQDTRHEACICHLPSLIAEAFRKQFFFRNLCWRPTWQLLAHLKKNWGKIFISYFQPSFSMNTFQHILNQTHFSMSAKIHSFSKSNLNCWIWSKWFN